MCTFHSEARAHIPGVLQLHVEVAPALSCGFALDEAARLAYNDITEVGINDVAPEQV